MTGSPGAGTGEMRGPDKSADLQLDSLRSTALDLASAFRHPYLCVFALSLALRLILFYIGSVQTESLEAFATLFPDGRLYAESARAIASEFNWNTQGVQVFGPGYPALLAVVGWLTSHQPAWLLFCQILVAASGSVLLSILAYRLTSDRAVATVAGLLNAASLAAISLSNAMLSDSVFFVTVVAGLVQFEKAASYGSLRRGLVAGLLLGGAVLIRSAGFAVLALLPFFLLHHREALGRTWRGALRHGWRVLALALVSALALPGLWALRNLVVYDLAYVSKAGAVAQVRMAAAIQHKIDGTDIEVALQVIGDSIVAQAKASPEFERTYLEASAQHLWKRVKSHPGAALRSYVNTTDLAAHTDWGVLLIQLPDWDGPIRDLIHRSGRYLVRYRTALLSLVGLVLLLAMGRVRLAVTLAVVYVWFAMLAGLTLWQGNRIFYPGQIAWTVLVAVVLVTAARYGVRPRSPLCTPQERSCDIQHP